jgi:hypothetical protein
MGVLNIVFGSLYLLCNLCLGGLLLLMFGGSIDAKAFPGGINPFKDMWDFMQVEVPAFAVVTIGEIIANFALSVMLIIAGIGLLKVQSWGRALSIAYGVLTILVKLADIAFTIAVVNPATERWQQDFQRRHGVAMAGQGDAYMNNIGWLVGVILSMGYGVVLLIMMLLPSVSAALAGPSRTEEYDLDRRDDLDDDLERERRRHEEWPE